MSEKKRYGDPRKQEAFEESKRVGGRSKGELSVGFIFFAWALFFLLWLVAGSLVVAAVVCGLLLTVAIAVLNAR
jgi:hypothetical protein